MNPAHPLQFCVAGIRHANTVLICARSLEATGKIRIRSSAVANAALVRQTATLSAMAGAATPEKVRVVVGDDHPLFREGVVRALASSGSVNVVGEADDGTAGTRN